ncbi:MAG: serine/threonine-protein kinase [Polyangiales bacterium]
MPVPSPGSTIPLQRGGESFHVGRVLGTGGMGTVVEATHAPSGRRVALKFLHDELLDHPTIPQRFAREVELATSLTTAHVARTFGVERTSHGTPFMIMELLEGRDLNGLIRKEGPLPPWRASRLIGQACEALEEAHARGIVHRDLKPENLFITTSADGGDWVKVLDFGISKVADDGPANISRPKLTRVGTTVGTPEYMAPEQLRGARDLDGSADVYSLGCVLYEALSARRPFTSPKYEELVRMICGTDPTPLQQLRSDLPPQLCQVIAKAMARDRKQRIPTARGLREALIPYMTGRRSEGTVMMEPTVAMAPSGPISGPVSIPMHPSPTPGMRASPPVSPPPPQPTYTRSDTMVEDSEGGGGGGKTFLVIAVVMVVLLLAGGAFLLFGPGLDLR